MADRGRRGGLVRGALIVAALAACSGDDAAPDGGAGMDAPMGPDRRSEALANIGTQVILPTYRELEAALGMLVARTEAYASAPTATARTEAQTAWTDAMDVLERPL